MTPSSGNAVRPPKRHYRRPCSWETFEKLFDPIMRDEETVL